LAHPSLLETTTYSPNRKSATLKVFCAATVTGRISALAARPLSMMMAFSSAATAGPYASHPSSTAAKLVVLMTLTGVSLPWSWHQARAIPTALQFGILLPRQRVSR